MTVQALEIMVESDKTAKAYRLSRWIATRQDLGSDSQQGQRRSAPEGRMLASIGIRIRNWMRYLRAGDIIADHGSRPRVSSERTISEETLGSTTVP